MYEIALCPSHTARAMRTAGPYPDREAAAKAARERNEAEGRDGRAERWYWARVGDVPRRPNCVSEPALSS